MSSTRETYSERVERFARRAEQLGGRSRLVSNLRGLSFGALVIFGLAAIFGEQGALYGAVSAGSALLFAVFVYRHARVIAAEDDAWCWVTVNRNAEARSSDRWHEFPDDGSAFAIKEHPYAGDLDVFGKGSLFQRINVAHTHYGQAALARFLSEPASVEEIRRRQEGARALAPELELRQRLEALALGVTGALVRSVVGSIDPARTANRKPADPEGFLAWAESEPRLSRRARIVWAARLLPPVTLAAMGAAWAFDLSPAVWLVPVVIQVALNAAAREDTGRTFHAVSSTQGAFLRYAPLLELLERIDVRAEIVAELKARMLRTEQRPSTSMRRFQRALGWFELRHNGLIHPIVNAVLMWDVHCVLALEAWQASSGREVRGWFAAVGELEALSSFAGLAYDEPAFCWPEVDAGPPRFEASSLGHPLIAGDRRVENDVSLPAPGQALLITGSNMSGKSTLMRAMGLGAVMALAGAPVCARRLVVSRLDVQTSMRVSDSLEQGVSHFYAEISKLKRVLSAAEEGRPVFFLLDEILHGTNSHERQIGARWLLARLLELSAIGAVSTHDIELCRLEPPLMDRVAQYHFRETVEDGGMRFDYRLRPGAVSGGNALRLMRTLGIDVPIEA